MSCISISYYNSRLCSAASRLQACYGILKVPQGNWLCRTCALGVQPKCLLCPKRGGALKPTRSGTKWVHVSCALWIPEVRAADINTICILVFSLTLDFQVGKWPYSPFKPELQFLQSTHNTSSEKDFSAAVGI